MNNNELIHWGILGQKKGLRRYQNPDGSLTPEGKIRYGKGHKKRLTKEAIEKKRAEVLRSDNPKLAYKHSNLFTSEELNALYKRLDTRQKIADIAANDAKNKQKVNTGKRFIEKVNTAIAVTQKLSEAYYTAETVLNSPGAYGRKAEKKKKKKKEDD